MIVAPTRSNLLKIKKQLSVAKEGYNLLDEKREVLIMELMDNVHGYKEIEEEVTEKLNEAYKSLEDAFVFIGKESLKKFSKSNKEPIVNIRMRSVMGIPVPELLIEREKEGVVASMDSTNEYFDKALIKFRGILEIIVKWATKEALLWQLGAEINKTQKRVNALSNIFIPKYKKEIKKIEEFLEEEEREEFFKRKRLKSGEQKQ